MLEAVADSYQTTDDGKKREDHQRNQHDHRTLVRRAVPIVPVAGVGVSMIINLDSVVVTEKRHKEQTEHVERSDESGDDADQPEDPATVRAGIGLPQNFV